MAGTVIYKMSGSGNDFIFIDGREHPADSWQEQRIRELCQRRTGVGADGLVVLEPGSRDAAVRFHYFNADGRRVQMCGNASLCAARLAVVLGMARAEGMTLETDAGPVSVRSLPGADQWAKLSLPDVDPAVEMAGIDLVEGEHLSYLVRVGVPHLVIVVDDVDAPSANPEIRGRALRHHPALGPEGANVNFVTPEPDLCRVRTFERGVEAETMACGTGAVAVAMVLAVTDLRELPVELVTRIGKRLAVSGTLAPTGELLEPRLAGEGRLVFKALMADD